MTRDEQLHEHAFQYAAQYKAGMLDSVEEACYMTAKVVDEHPRIVQTKVNAFDQIQFDVNTPGFLKEIVDNSQTKMYPITFKLFARLLEQVAERATELHDPVMDALMIRLNLYDLPVNERRKTVAKLEQYMKEQSQQ